jgi:dihydrofolate synthase/folylpolyglutamate synthase
VTGAEALGLLARFASLEQAAMRPGLERIEALLEALGRPERGLRVVHVAGTNGKGSVSALTEAVLRAGGLRTGLFTSPHLLDLRERIRVDGRPVAAETLAPVVAALAGALTDGRATFFEVMTAVALAVFRSAGVAAAVLEVGLGGRWDATNVGRPLVSVLTRIDHDHQAYLGSRLEEIAAEKAAIVRGGVALSAAQEPAAAEVVAARSRAVGVPLLVVGRELRVERLQSDLRGHRLDLALDGRGAGLGPPWTLRDVALALPGLYQPENAILAVGAARAFAARAGLALPDAAVRTGCATVRWPGRFQVVPGAGARPTVVLDGAHNPAGAAALAASLRHLLPGASLTLVVGVSADKDRAGILKALAPLAARLILTAAEHPRATAPADLAADLPPVEGEVLLEPEPGRALARALEGPGGGVVCVTGSLFLVGDALRRLRDRGCDVGV